MLRSASHRLSGIIAFLISGLVVLCVHDTRIGHTIAVEAHAEEIAQLGPIYGLVKHDGFALTREAFCDGSDLWNLFDGNGKGFTVVGVTVHPDDLAKINPKYPKDYDAGFATIIDRSTPTPKVGDIDDLVLRLTNVIFCRTSGQNLPGFAFSVTADGLIILPAARGEKVGNAYRWSDADMTAEMQEIFSTELQLWSSPAMLHFVENLPNKH